MLDALAHLLCSKLCQHNWPRPKQHSYQEQLQLYEQNLKVLKILLIICTESHTIVNEDGVHGGASTVGGHYSDGVLGIVEDIEDDYVRV